MSRHQSKKQITFLIRYVLEKQTSSRLFFAHVDSEENYQRDEDTYRWRYIWNRINLENRIDDTSEDFYFPVSTLNLLLIK